MLPRTLHALYIVELVPIPGRVRRVEIAVTSTASAQKRSQVHRHAFERRGNSLPAWERVVGIVVQPGVEFGDETIADYIPQHAAELSQWILSVEGIVFEAHSTDYQMEESLRHLIRDHFAILKVGPELTFVLREAVSAWPTLRKNGSPMPVGRVSAPSSIG